MHVVTRTAVGLCLGALIAGGVSAQQRTVQQLLTHLNTQLRENAYEDFDGQQTTSQVALPDDGTILVEIVKRKAGNEVTNVFVTSLRDVDPAHIVTRRREDHFALSLGARGEVRVTLRCTTRGGPTSEWSLPATRDLVVEFRRDAELAGQLELEFAELIRRAKADPEAARN